jgi:hypothetical protein
MSTRNKRRILLFGLIALLISAVLAVQVLVGDQQAPKLAGSRPSMERLSVDFLNALEEGDEETIRQLALNKEQFSEFVWPELPASDSGTNLNADWVWNQTQMRSLVDLSTTLFSHRGKHYELVEFRFEDETEDYRSFKVHRDARLMVVDEVGEERELNLFGSVLEIDDEFKIYSFVR